MRRLLLVMVVLVGFLALPRAANAGLITGELDIAGGVVVDANNANWFLTVTPPSGPPATGPQEALVIGTSLMDGGVLAPITPLVTLVHETNLNFTTFPPGDITPPFDMFEFPCTAPCTTANPPIDFVLTHINTCAENGGTPNVTCFGNSPFLFTEHTVGGTTKTDVTLNLFGTVHDTTTPNLISNWTGNFTGNFNGSIADLFAVIEAGGTIGNSFSATKIVIAPAAVPEPATLLMFGTGTAIFGAMRRRKNAKNKNV
jgi:hypothetical protein